MRALPVVALLLYALVQLRAGRRVLGGALLAAAMLMAIE